MDALSGLRIARADPSDPALRDLIARHHAHSAAHYPTDSNHHLDAAELAHPDIVVFGGWRDGVLVAMGAVRDLGGGCAEIKSMHVAEPARGTGAGAAILDRLLDEAQARGLTTVLLETGSRDASAAARGLYLSRGFVPCPPFGDYTDDPESVFMRRGPA